MASVLEDTHGAASRRPVWRLRVKEALLPSFAVLVMFFLFAPMVVMLGGAFNDNTTLAFPPNDPTLHWFDTMISDPQFRRSLVTSAELSATIAVVSVLAGTAFALAATRRRGIWFAFTTLLANAPLALPGVFIGVALFSAFLYAAIAMSAYSALLGQFLYVLPFVIAVITARLANFDLQLEEAARGLGYSRPATFVFVTLRLAAPAILGAAVLAFVLSFDEVYITNFIIGPDSTLPVYILGEFRTGIDPRLNAVAVVLLAVPLAVLGIYAVARRSRFATQEVVLGAGDASDGAEARA
jgi:ABC-type spermidine/putrescine transport system permease subunit II